MSTWILDAVDVGPCLTMNNFVKCHDYLKVGGCYLRQPRRGPWTPLEGAKLHQKVQKWILEGAKIKDFGRLNTSLEGTELFGPPKIRAQLRLCY